MIAEIRYGGWVEEFSLDMVIQASLLLWVMSVFSVHAQHFAPFFLIYLTEERVMKVYFFFVFLFFLQSGALFIYFPGFIGYSRV